MMWKLIIILNVVRGLPVTPTIIDGYPNEQICKIAADKITGWRDYAYCIPAPVVVR